MSAETMSVTIKTVGSGRQEMEIMVKDMCGEQSDCHIEIIEKIGEIDLLVTVQAEDKKQAKSRLKAVTGQLKERLGVQIFAVGSDATLEEAVVALLKACDWKLATAESCTGGMIGSRIVNVPGSSDVYKGGFITYSNKMKRKCLDVSKKTLKNFGAVSHQTAKEMAKGCMFATDADVCVAVTGIAGPGGGTEEKPVGLVYISCAIADELYVSECHFEGTREEIRIQSTMYALNMVRLCILRKRCDLSVERSERNNKNYGRNRKDSKTTSKKEES